MRIFSTKYEVNSMRRGIHKDLTEHAGQFVQWRRLDTEATTPHPIYDIGYSRVWGAPFLVHCVSALRLEGFAQATDGGLYTRDRIQLVIGWDEAQRRDIASLADAHEDYLTHLITYDSLQFTPTDVQAMGALKEHDTILRVLAREVRGDEFVHDTQFEDLANEQ